MQIACNQLLPLASFLVCVATTTAQTPAPPDCKGMKDVSSESISQSEMAACKLQFAPACERIPQLRDAAIFIGKVTSIARTEGKVLLNGHCERTALQTVTMTVRESFSGPLPSKVIIHAGFNTEFFEDRETALVYAKKLPDETLAAFACSGTMPTDRKLQLPKLNEDLAYLHSRGNLPPTSNLFGTTWVDLPERENHMNASFGFENQSITITGPRSIKIITPKSGSFQLDDLPPGQYTLHIDTPFPVWPGKDQQVDLLPRGCAKADFHIESSVDYRRISTRFAKARAKK